MLCLIILLFLKTFKVERLEIQVYLKNNIGLGHSFFTILEFL